MNMDKMQQEIRGHQNRISELLARKFTIQKERDKLNKEEETLDISIMEENAIIQTLEFVTKTQGFATIPCQQQVIKEERKDGKNERK